MHVTAYLVPYLLDECKVVSAWGAIGLALIGVGLLLRRLAGLRGIGARSLLDSFWLGLAATVAILQVWHLLLPVDDAIAWVVGSLGAAGLWAEARSVRGWLSSLGGRRRMLGAAALLAIGLFGASRMLGPVTYYDTGMYHIPTVVWYKAYAVVPGLANLHGRLGFNSSFLLFGALVDRGPLAGRSAFIALGLLLVAVLVQSCYGGWRLWRRRSRSGADFFDLILLTPVVGVLMAYDARSLSTDVAAATVLMVATSRLLRILRSERSDSGERAFDVVFVAALLALAPTFKLTAAPFAFGAWLLLLVVWLRSSELTAARRRTVLPVVAAASAGLVVPWMVHGGMLSGYPLFPVRLARWPVDWRVPTREAAAELAFSRYSGVNEWTVLSPFLDPWGWKQSMDRVRIVLPILITVGSTLALGLRRLRDRTSRGAFTSRGELALGALTAVSVAIWYVSAPWPRFGFAVLWILGALLASHVFRGVPSTRSRLVDRDRIAVVAAFLLAAYPIVDSGTALGHVLDGRDPIKEVARQLLPSAGPSTWLTIRPDRKLHPYRTASGLKVSVPPIDQKSPDMRCWYARPPCTPHPAPDLELRKPGSLGSGFRITGRWEPKDWPTPMSHFLAHWRAARSRRNAG